jgi:hypothetical protein
VRWVLPLLLSSALGACASQPPPAASAPSEAPIAHGDSSTRALTQSECESLGQWIVAACHERVNMDRSEQAEGWCGEVARGTSEGGTWVSGQCMKHIKYMDAVCFRSTTKVRTLMDCDTNVDRSP